jgi:hypothetical protein
MLLIIGKNLMKWNKVKKKNFDETIFFIHQNMKCPNHQNIHDLMHPFLKFYIYQSSNSFFRITN